MIDTRQEIINGRDARNGQKTRPAAKNAACDDLWISIKTLAKRAPIGHEMACFWLPPEGASRRKSLVFSEKTRDAAPRKPTQRAALSANRPNYQSPQGAERGIGGIGRMTQNQKSRFGSSLRAVGWSRLPPARRKEQPTDSAKEQIKESSHG